MTASERKAQQFLKRSNLPLRYLGVGMPDGFSNQLLTYWTEQFLAGNVVKSEGQVGVTGVGLHIVGGSNAQHVAAAIINQVNTAVTDYGAFYKYSSQNFLNVDSPYKYTTFADLLNLKKQAMELRGDAWEDANFDIEGAHGRLPLKEDWGNVRLLMLANVDLPPLTEYSQSSLSDLLVSRYNKALPTILVSKINNQDLRRMYGKAVDDVLTEGLIEVKI